MLLNVKIIHSIFTGFQWGTPENAASIMGVNMAIVPVLICITLRVIN